MAATIWYENDGDLSVLSGKKVAILGYGSQGHAHALNLRDSGVDVVVGLRPSSKSVEFAKEQGLEVKSIEDAVAEADVVMILLPDQYQAKVYKEQVEPNLKPGAALAFAHGFNIHYGYIKPTEDHPVFMVAPKGPGHIVRREYAAGRGVPVVVAVQQDPRGDAWDLTLAYAKALGALRAGAIKTTFKEETRNRSVRRAERAARRREQARRDGLRGPHRRRLSAGDRLLRGLPRAQDDRGSDERRRPEQGSLVLLRHRPVRRLRQHLHRRACP